MLPLAVGCTGAVASDTGNCGSIIDPEGSEVVLALPGNFTIGSDSAVKEEGRSAVVDLKDTTVAGRFNDLDEAERSSMEAEIADKENIAGPVSPTDGREIEAEET